MDVLVPVCDCGAGVAFVRDVRRGDRVRVETHALTLVNRVVCVAARSHGVEDGLHRVTLPGKIAAWVRAVCVPAGTAA